MKKTSYFVVIVLLLLAVLGCRSSQVTEDFPPSLRHLLGEEICQLVSTAQRVEFYHLNAMMDYERNNIPAMLRGIPIVAGPIQLDKAQKQALRLWLTEPGHYLIEDQGIAKRCFFEPESGFRFITDRDTTDILVSLNCLELRAYNQNTIRVEDIDPGERAWGQLLSYLTTNP
jgi:hypothetical protein